MILRWWKRQKPGDPLKYVDYEGHHRRDILKRGDGSYVVMWRVEGLSAEAVDPDVQYARRFDFNGMIVNLHSDRLVFSAHETRIDADPSVYEDSALVSEYAQILNDDYRAQITTGPAPLYENIQHFSLTVRPSAPLGKATGVLSAARLVEEEPPEETFKFIDDRIAQIEARLKHYKLRRLGVRFENDMPFSEMLEALVVIHSGRRAKVSLPDGHAGDSIYCERAAWGPRKSIRIYGASGRPRYASVFGFKVPGRECPPWIFHHLKSAQFHYSFSRHFHLLSIPTGDAQLKRKQNEIPAANDPAAFDQMPLIAELRSRYVNRRIVVGNHANVLTVFADTPEGLELVAPEAESMLSSGGGQVVREDLCDLAAYWAQLPGNLECWPRPMPVHSDNFASFASQAGYPIGPEKSRWGPPATIYRSAGGTPVRQHLHIADVPIMAWFGPTGSGKSTAMLHLIAMCEKYSAKVRFFDQYRGAENGIRAMKGDYNVLVDGEPTFCAPLKAFDKNDRLDMAMLRYLARGMIGGEIDREDARSIHLALQMVMDLPPTDRSWGEVRAFLGHKRGGIGERLEPWCWPNELGWALDSREDRFSSDARLAAYDTTNVLENKIALGPLQACMSYRTQRLIDGSRVIVCVDEFHHWLEDPFWAPRAASMARTIRRRNGSFWYGTQHPADLDKCLFGHAIMQQTPQQFFFPDPRAREEHYIGGAQVTERMFHLIKREMKPKSGQFIRVIEGDAMVLELPLRGMDAHLAVLSSRDHTVAFASQIRQKNPQGWVSEFMERYEEAAA
jgi:type IV secretion system protein VirB4